MPTELASRLRSDTREAHQHLEDALALLEGRPTAARFLQALERFHGFHAVWEAGVAAASPPLASVFAGRSRLDALRRDLLALGLAPEEVDRLPRCGAARALTGDPRAALGSLYVMEGSTLGGQVISRAIADATWAPPGGLAYFAPYGAETGPRWRALQAVLNAAPAADHAAIVEGALATFATLRDWMQAGTESRASAGVGALRA